MACVFNMSMMRFESAATLPSPHSDEGRTATRILRATMYPLLTGLIIAITVFLIWSLFRFLLSLADFIYVVTDVHGEHHMARDMMVGGDQVHCWRLGLSARLRSFNNADVGYMHIHMQDTHTTHGDCIVD